MNKIKEIVGWSNAPLTGKVLLVAGAVALSLLVLSGVVSVF